VLSECLGNSSMRLGVPFIAPRQLGAIGGKLGRPSLPSVEWQTGQSGAPPDNHCSLSSARFPSKSGRADRCSFGPDGTSDTVRCTQPIVGAATCRALIARSTVGDRWLTGLSALKVFLRATSLPRMTHRTIRCTTRQSSDF
jgi:hypothetical protein